MTMIFELGKMSRDFARDVTRQIQIEIDEASAGSQDVRITVEPLPVGSITRTRKRTV